MIISRIYKELLQPNTKKVSVKMWAKELIGVSLKKTDSWPVSTQKDVQYH